MTALPMIARCAWAQWRGLTDSERVELRRSRTFLYCHNAVSLETPIWSAVSSYRSIAILSVKRDVVL